MADAFLTSILGEANKMILKESLQLRVPMLFEVALFAYCIQVCIGRRNLIAKQNAAQGIAEAALAAFGGGIMVPVLLHDQNIHVFPLAYDYAILFMASSFFLVHHFPAVCDIVEGVTILKVTFSSLFELARCRIMLTWLTHANMVLPASNFPFPVIGPIVCGTLGGCGGALIVGGGLKALAKPSRGMYTAFFVSMAYHALVHCARMLSASDGACLAACVFVAFRIHDAVDAPSTAAAAKPQRRSRRIATRSSARKSKGD